MFTIFGHFVGWAASIFTHPSSETTVDLENSRKRLIRGEMSPSNPLSVVLFLESLLPGGRFVAHLSARCSGCWSFFFFSFCRSQSAGFRRERARSRSAQMVRFRTLGWRTSDPASLDPPGPPKPPAVRLLMELKPGLSSHRY